MALETKIEKREAERQAAQEEVELASFAQNVNTFSHIVARMEAEISNGNPNVDRLNIYRSEVESMLGELQAQQRRAIDLRGEKDDCVQSLQHILLVRLTKVVEETEKILESSQSKLADLNKQLIALESIEQQVLTLQVNEVTAPYGPTDVHLIEVPITGSELTTALAHSSEEIRKLIDSRPDIRQSLLPVMRDLVHLSIRSAAGGLSSDLAGPPRGPVDTSTEAEDDDRMEARISNLEKFADEARKDLRSVDVRLAKIETVLDSISQNMSTKSDTADIKIAFAHFEGAAKHMATSADVAKVQTSVAKMQSRILIWAISTLLAATGVAFTAARYFS